MPTYKGYEYLDNIVQCCDTCQGIYGFGKHSHEFCRIRDAFVTRFNICNKWEEQWNLVGRIAAVKANITRHEKFERRRQAIIERNKREGGI